MKTINTSYMIYKRDINSNTRHISYKTNTPTKNGSLINYKTCIVWYKYLPYRL